MKKIDAIVFDLDSTLVKIEGLDWLAVHKKVDHEVVELTKKSMEGSLDFNSAMVQKMKLLSPSYKDLELLGEAYCQNIVPGIEEAIAYFQSKNVEVWILTGNFEPAVKIIAKRLGINLEHVISNEVFFDQNGQYVGFNSESPLAHNGGKAKLIEKVIQNKKRKVVYVGDGATDLDVKNYVSLFIGFGGIVERELVKKNSDVYISDPNFEQLINIVYTHIE